MSDAARPGLRDRLGAALTGSRLAAALEALVVPLLIGLHAAGLMVKPKLPLLLFAWASLWLRRVGWRRVGLARPSNWPATLSAAVVIGLVYDALDIGVIIPALHRATGEPLDLTQLGAVQGDAGLLLLLTAAAWLSAAFPEELLYRGYLLDRLAGLFGPAGAVRGRAIAVALVSFVFGFAHHAQGVTGVLDNVVAGLLFAILYLISGRNLWLPILAHGVIDTASALLLYLGFHP